MTSMKDISRVCGVSTATVSKALNNRSDVAEETKARICQVARELGYFPNSSARALKTKRTYNLGVLFVDEAQSGLTHDYFANVLNSFKKVAEEKGYDITFINAGRKQRTQMTYLEHCRYRGFDGVVIACVDFRNPEVEELVKSDIPLITIDHTFYGRAAVVSDNVKGMRDLLAYIVGRGHRKIAYIHGADSAVTRNRVSSFFRTAEELGIAVPEEYVREAAYRDTREAGAATEQLLALADPPTCIMYPDDFSCFGGINVIKEKGLRIPEDISVAGYDGIRIGRHIEPQLTTLRQDTAALGRKAAEILIDLIERPKTTIVEQVVIGGEVYDGKTVGEI